MDTSTPVILSDCYSKASSRTFHCHLTPADGSLRCFRSATLPFHRISYEITYKFIIDQVSCQPFIRLKNLKNRFHTQTIIQLLNQPKIRVNLPYKKNSTTQQTYNRIMPGLVMRHLLQPRTVFPCTYVLISFHLQMKRISPPSINTPMRVSWVTDANIAATSFSSTTRISRIGITLPQKLTII